MSKVNLVIVATINHNEKEALTHYLKHVGILYEKYQAKSVSKYKVSEALIGEYTPSLVSIMEFPDRSSLNQLFDGAEYKELLPSREKAFVKVEAYISE